MGSPEIKLIPTEFDVGVDLTATTSSVITGDRDAPIALRLDPVAVSATLRGDEDAPLAMKAGLDLDLKNLPHLTYEQITGLLQTATLAKSRIRFPLDLNFGFSIFPLTLLGIDAMTFSVCGEPEVIRDDCVPDCEEPCVEKDPRGRD